MKNNQKKAIYAGTFDPITLGHLDIILRSLRLFDRVVVAVAENTSKNPLLSLDARLTLIKESLQEVSEKELQDYQLDRKDLERLEIVSFDNLLVDLASKKNAQFLLRSMRSTADCDYEIMLARVNSQLANNLETVFLTANPKFFHISSTVVREVLKHQGDISAFVPDCVKKFFDN